MAVFNEDIVEHILDSYDHWWPRDFCRLALVSSTWLHPARKRLYGCPTLVSYRACHRLARTLETNPILINLIHELDIRPLDASQWAADDTYGHVPGFCPGVPRLLALTRLERLTLGGDLSRSAERFLRIVAAPHTVKALRIVAEYNDDYAFHENIFSWNGELALRFSALESLSLDGRLMLDVDDSHYDTDAVGDSARGATLKELHLNCIELSESSGAISALLHTPASWRSLRLLKFGLRRYAPANLWQLAALLADVHGTLEHLCLRSYKDEGTITPTGEGAASDLLACLRRVPLLQHLRALETSYGFIHSELGAVFPAVERIDVVGGFGYSEVHTWARHISPDSFAHLKMLVLHAREQWWIQSTNEFSSLADACKRCDVELECVRA